MTGRRSARRVVVVAMLVAVCAICAVAVAATNAPALAAKAPTGAWPRAASPIPARRPAPGPAPSSAPRPFAAPAGELVFVRGGDLWRSALDGSGAAPVTATPSLAERRPQWIPGTVDVVFSAVVTPAPAAPAAGELWRGPTDGSGPATRLVSPSAREAGAFGVGVSAPSADGARIAFDFRPTVAGTPVTLNSVSATGGALSPLGVASVLSEPAWWPGGDRIAVVKDEGSYSNIYVMSPSGTLVARLTGASRAGQRWTRPAWSPSGEWLTASYDRGAGESHLYKLRFDGSSSVRLTAHPAGRVFDTASAWTADGSRLVFERSDPQARGSSLFSIHASPAAGESPTLVATDAADPTAWRPVVVYRPRVVASPGTVDCRPAVGRRAARPASVAIGAHLPSGPTGTPMRLWARQAGGAWTSAGTLLPGASRTLSMARNTRFYAAASGSATASACMSGVVSVAVRPALTVVWSRLAIPADRQVGIVGQVWPMHDGPAVFLQRKVGRKWRTIMRSRLTKSGSASSYYFIFTPGRRGRFVLRVYVPADADHADVASQPKTVFAR